ncbi:hypothetical protein KUTeg_007906 [Tegillarca granosa]|uniref:Uncharacterized protein n=1 Tax=Tegillarca granosa TaxID=220873 RepID=A0ABQ9FEM2_TEGGR|nr:hypothetical protein KUTeg_007906 [Tegillarca granosa]
MSKTTSLDMYGIVIDSYIKVPNFYKISALETSSMVHLLECYRQMYPTKCIQITDINEVIRKFGHIVLVGERFGSRMDCRSSKSANILANWHCKENDIDVAVDSIGLKPCSIEFFFSHVLSLDGEEVRHYFCKVKWFKEYEDRNKYGSLLQMWHFRKFEDCHSSRFLPVQRIRSRFVYGLTGESKDLMVVSQIPRKNYQHETGNRNIFLHQIFYNEVMVFAEWYMIILHSILQPVESMVTYSILQPVETMVPHSISQPMETMIPQQYSTTGGNHVSPKSKPPSSSSCSSLRFLKRAANESSTAGSGFSSSFGFSGSSSAGFSSKEPKSNPPSSSSDTCLLLNFGMSSLSFSSSFGFSDSAGFSSAGFSSKELKSNPPSSSSDSCFLLNFGTSSLGENLLSTKKCNQLRHKYLRNGHWPKLTRESTDLHLSTVTEVSTHKYIKVVNENMKVTMNRTIQKKSYVRTQTKSRIIIYCKVHAGVESMLKLKQKSQSKCKINTMQTKEVVINLGIESNGKKEL